MQLLPHNLLSKNTSHPITDMHCDLLCYLSNNKKRSAYDLAVRCSIPQLKNGNVKIQVMAIFSETTPGSVDSGLAQAAIYKKLPQEYPNCFRHTHDSSLFSEIENSETIGIYPAIENASCFCDEQESLETGFQRLDIMMRRIGKPLYVSFTWNTENRFGGGALTSMGLKSDGKRLIDLLAQKKVAIDLSHASDHLAHDIIDYLEKYNLDIPLLASHSNFRSVANVPRNLTDDLAKEILSRKGIIGLNFVRPFVGADSPENFVHQLEWALKLTNGSAKGICFGADFFYGEDVSPAHRKEPHDLFFPGYNQAGVYAQVVEMWRKKLALKEDVLAGICYANALQFLAAQSYR